MTALAIVAPTAGAGGSPGGAPGLAGTPVPDVTLRRDGDLRAAARSQGCYDA